MPVPTSITDLSTTASSNPPAGSETPQEGDNHLRAAYSFIRTLYDRITDGLQNLTISGLTVNGTLAGNLIGSTYTPTATAVANVDSATPSSFQYARVGGSVFGSGRVLVNPTALGGLTQFRLSLPIASNFTAAGECAGGGAGSMATSTDVPVQVSADATNDAMLVEFVAQEGAPSYYYIWFMYRVL